MNPSAPPTEVAVAIVGAGFAGLCMAIQLKEAGIRDFVVLEAGPGVGGTWRDNTYPGCACDVPSHLYSYSFARRSDWSRKFSAQPEILAYIEGCVEKFELGPFLRFGAEVRSATFDAAAGRWRLRTAAGEEVTARALVSAVGGLRVPEIPALPGIESFGGPAFHSARWDHGVELRGRRVAVIGTGASAIQFVPQIAAEVGHLALFQRTPPWVLPKPDRAFTAGEKALFAGLPGATRLYRAGIYGKLEASALLLLRRGPLLKVAAALGRRHIAAQIADPALRAKVTPRYEVGCKRILLANDYYPALCRPNVEVITDGIARVEPGAIVTTTGARVAADVIIYGTGFRVRDFLAPMRVVGPEGQELGEVWRAGAAAYYGIAVSGFPNFYVLVGPNTGLGHNSIVFMIEAQVRFAVQCVRRILGEDLRALDVLPAAQGRVMAEIAGRMGRTVWQSGCKSWYLDARGRNETLWPGFTWEYWLRTRRVRWADFAAA